MGKRSTFDRIEKDFYRTIDPKAGQALLRIMNYLDIESLNYYEPCFGDGDLVDNLEQVAPERFSCMGSSDITTGKDALSLTKEDLEDCDCIITNPPWSRPILHSMIDHFSTLGKPFFLLFDADWSHNKSSVPYMKKLGGIYPTGRLRWIPDTKMSSKDNCAWYLFEKNYPDHIEFKNLR